MASLWIPVLILGVLTTPAGGIGICVHAPPLELNEDVAAGTGVATPCTGFLETNEGTPICGHISSPSAERACWELQCNQAIVHGLKTKTYRCNAGENDVATEGAGTDEHWVLLKGLIDYNCPDGSPDCFLDCHTDINNAAAGLLDMDACDADVKTAVDGTDIDECKEGVFHDCVSGFDHECLIGTACSNNTLCINHPGSYECQCLAGYAGDPYNFTDCCEDVNECLTLPNPCPGDAEQCHNTIGSFVCQCIPGFVWDDTANACVEVMCPSLVDDIDDATLLGNEYTCETGYEPSFGDDYGIHLQCRGDDYCHCAAPNCVRKSCGVPRMDPNAWTIKNDALHEGELDYVCYPGFVNDYTLDCEDGDWEVPSTYCENIDECDAGTDDCPTNSDCIDTIGSFHCDCHPGYEGPDCTPVSCGKIPEVDNAKRTTQITEEDSVFELAYVYECEEGYRASNANDPKDIMNTFTITCKLDKTWDHRPIPECIPIFCGDPGTVAHSTRYGDNFHYWEQVAYTCYDGFKPSGQGATDDRQFRMRCEADQGWDGMMTCENVNECEVLTKPCGVGEGHYCIDNVGSYICSCAPKHRLDHTGKNCVPASPVEETPGEPCELYNALGFCHQGTCYLDDRDTPRCRCDEGFEGPFCDEDDRISLDIPYILALLALSVIGFCIVIFIILSCYVCAKHYDDPANCPEPCPTPPPVYKHTPPQMPKFLPIPVPSQCCCPDPCPEHSHKVAPAPQPQQQKYEVRYIAKQVPVNGQTPVAGLPLGGVYQQQQQYAPTLQIQQ